MAVRQTRPRCGLFHFRSLDYVRRTVGLFSRQYGVLLRNGLQISPGVILRAVGTCTVRGLIPLLGGGKNEHDADENGEALEPQNQ